MNLFQLSTFGAITGTLAMVLTYIYLYALYRERYIGMWIISWTVLLFRVIFFDSEFINWKSSIAGIITYQLFFLACAIPFIYGVHLFINKPVNKYWLYGIVTAAILSIASTIMQMPIVYNLIPPICFACVMLLYAGNVFLNIQTPGVGKYITGGAFFLWSLFTSTFPFFIYGSGLPWRLNLINGILRLIITSGTLMVYFEKTRADLINNEESLRQSNRELNSFCHSVAHDVKAPLLSINKLAEYLALDYKDKLDGDGHEIIRNIQEKSTEVIKITDRLLELSKMCGIQMKFEVIRLESLFREVYEELINLQPERQVAFHIKQLPDIHGDPVMIKLLVRNVLSNALKFTRNREQAVIEVDTQEDANNYIISVKDNGAGFDMRYSSRLFGVFERLHSNNEFEGSGVGLTISQKILQRHHGKAWLAGKVDEGAVFSFSFPKELQEQHSWPILVLPDNVKPVSSDK